MTVSTETMVDPNDPLLLYEPAQYVADEGNRATTFAEAGLALGAAFLFYRAFAGASLDLKPGRINPTTLRAAAYVAYQKVAPFWLQAAVPAIARAYQLGSTELTNEEAQFLAQDYAASLGDYIHQSSADALVEGYQSLVNRKWSPELAYQRAKYGYGLDSQQMQAYVNSLDVTRNAVFSKLPSAPDISESLVDRLLASRAQTIGENETWTIGQMGKQVVWLAAVAEGTLSETATKQWLTAADERVCPVCAPMDGQEVKVTQKFNVEGKGDLWGPAAHVNCRCVMVLSDSGSDEEGPGDLRKAFDPNEHPRGQPGNRGQFRRTNRARPARVAEREFTPEQQLVDEALRQAREVVGEPEAPAVEPVNPFGPQVTNPFATANVVNPFQTTAEVTNPFQTSLTEEVENPFAAKNPFRQAQINALRRKIALYDQRKEPVIVQGSEQAPEFRAMELYAKVDPFLEDRPYRVGDKITFTNQHGGGSFSGVPFQESSVQIFSDFVDEARDRALLYHIQEREGAPDQMEVDATYDFLRQHLNDWDTTDLVGFFNDVNVPVDARNKDYMISRLLDLYDDGIPEVVDAINEYFDDELERFHREWEIKHYEIGNEYEADYTVRLPMDWNPEMFMIDHPDESAISRGETPGGIPIWDVVGTYQVTRVSHDVRLEHGREHPWVPTLTTVHLERIPEEDEPPPAYLPHDLYDYEDERYGRHPRPNVEKRFKGRFVTYRRAGHAGR